MSRLAFQPFVQVQAVRIAAAQRPRHPSSLPTSTSSSGGLPKQPKEQSAPRVSFWMDMPESTPWETSRPGFVNNYHHESTFVALHLTCHQRLLRGAELWTDHHLEVSWIRHHGPKWMVTIVIKSPERTPAPFPRVIWPVTNILADSWRSVYKPTPTLCLLSGAIPAQEESPTHGQRMPTWSLAADPSNPLGRVHWSWLFNIFIWVLNWVYPDASPRTNLLL